MWLYESLDISLELGPSTQAEQEILPRTREQQEEWAAELEQVVVNPEEIGLQAPGVFGPSSIPPRWVLILPGSPDEEQEGRNSWIDTFAPLTAHRQSQGLDTEVRYLRQITQATGEQVVDAIRAYLRDQHANHNARWVCLVGDDQMIPWSYRNITASAPYFDPDTRIPNDWCYCDIDGEWIEYQPGMDWAPEMWAGRIPCITRTEAGYFVDKVLAYELNPSNGEDYGYLSRAFYESADEMTDDGTCEEVMAHQHPQLDATFWPEQPSGGSQNPTAPYASDIVNEINATGYNYFVVHCHGYSYYYQAMTAGYGGNATSLFTLENIESLDNQDYYFLWYSISCGNAALEAGPARVIAEGAVCVYEHRGAVAFAGSTRDVDELMATNLNCDAWDQLFPRFATPRHFNHAGAMEARSRQRGYQCADVSDGVRFAHNLFGDPATPIWTPDYMPGSQKPAAAVNSSGLPIIGSLRCAPVPMRERSLLRFKVNHRTLVTISLHDLAGRRLWQAALEQVASGEVVQPLECSGIPSGTYLLQLAAGESKVSERVVIVR